MITTNKSGYVQLALQALSMVAGFMVWVVISSLMPYIREDISLSAGQTALVTAIPVILGSLLRVPVGYLTNRYGAKIVHTVIFVILLFPVFLVSQAQSLAALIIGGFLLGVGGSVFSIGVTSIPKYFPKERHGFVNGIYGLGNAGTAVSVFLAPVAAAAFGWRATVQMYLALLLIFIAATFLFGDKDEPQVKTPVLEQIKSIYKLPKLWFFCLFYFITFGSFVAFTMYLPNFFVANFGFSKVNAGVVSAAFIVAATLTRPVGGWLADRFNGYKLLMIVFVGVTIFAAALAFTPGVKVYIACIMSLALLAGIGNGTVFKLVPENFLGQAGIVNGLVAAFGGLGGFFPPLILSWVHQMTGQYSIGFMLLSEAALASLVIVVVLFNANKSFKNTVQ